MTIDSRSVSRRAPSRGARGRGAPAAGPPPPRCAACVAPAPPPPARRAGLGGPPRAPAGTKARATVWPARLPRALARRPCDAWSRKLSMLGGSPTTGLAASRRRCIRSTTQAAGPASVQSPMHSCKPNLQRPLCRPNDAACPRNTASARAARQRTDFYLEATIRHALQGRPGWNIMHGRESSRRWGV